MEEALINDQAAFVADDEATAVAQPGEGRRRRAVPCRRRRVGSRQRLRRRVGSVLAWFRRGRPSARAAPLFIRQNWLAAIYHTLTAHRRPPYPKASHSTTYDAPSNDRLVIK